MKVDIIQKNYEMSEKLEDIILKKTERLSKYFGQDATIKIVLKNENDLRKMEFTALFNHTVIRSEVVGDNMYDNIDDILPKIEKQLIKNKEKLQSKLKENAFKDKQYLYLQTAPQEIPQKVVKAKEFDVIRRTIDEAISAMNMLEHDFYLYLDEDDGEIRVLYRRTDGNLGVIKPRYDD